MESTDTPRPAAPVDTAERATVLDAIRGFALSGVFLSNVIVWMSGMVFLSREQVAAASSGTLATVIGNLYGVLVAGKFMTMFTFLFGLGLSVQYSRAAARNDSAAKRYARRCLALFVLGVLHLTFLWYGDITHQYALIGLFVLLFRNRSTKTLIIWGLVLTLVAVPVGMWVRFLIPKLLQTANTATAQEDEFNRQALIAFQSSSYWTIVRMNLVMYWHHFFSAMIAAYNVATLGNFLLGLAVGRLGWFHDVPAHRRAFKRLLGWSAFASILTLVITFAIRHFSGGKVSPMAQSPVLSFFMPIITNVRTLSQALVYMSAIALLYQRGFFRRLLSIFEPVGKMAMTNYFMQSVIGLFVFTGIGLGQIGNLLLRWSIAMPIVMFTVQMIFSWIWLRYFRFGPVEWVSRSITYGKLQPMRLHKAASEVTT